MSGWKRLLVVAWVASFAAGTWWITTEGEVEVGTATVVGAIVASVLTLALSRLRK